MGSAPNQSAIATKQMVTLKAAGHSMRAIADEIGTTAATVCRHLKPAAIKAKVEALTAKLANEASDIIIQNHLDTIRRAANLINDLDPETGKPRKLDLQEVALLQLSDKKEDRIGRTLGIFPSNSQSIVIGNLFNGPANLQLDVRVSGLFSPLSLPDPSVSDDLQDEDIIDLEE
jgi:transposase